MVDVAGGHEGEQRPGGPGPALGAAYRRGHNAGVSSRPSAKREAGTSPRKGYPESPVRWRLGPGSASPPGMTARADLQVDEVGNDRIRFRRSVNVGPAWDGRRSETHRLRMATLLVGFAALYPPYRRSHPIPHRLAVGVTQVAVARQRPDGEEFRIAVVAQVEDAREADAGVVGLAPGPSASWVRARCSTPRAPPDGRRRRRP